MSPKPQKENQVKYILIILSILLLSSPLFGYRSGENTLFWLETSSGIQWKTFGDGNVQPKYKGEIKDFKPNGQGTITLSDGGNYVGEFKNGKPNGQGTMTLPDGTTKYIGEWKNGKPNGQGTEITTDGSKFVGEFKDDSFLNGIFYDKKGSIKSKMLNGKIK